MKQIKFLLLMFVISVFGVASVFADELADVKEFFNKYMSAANSYQTDVPDYYASDAKILRYVIQKDGTVYPTPLVIPMDEYKKQMGMNSKIAKLRNYKNFYKNIRVVKEGNNYKVLADRTPSTSPDDKLKAHFIIGKNVAGKYVIKEEMMESRVQTFLSQIKKQEKSK